ncbi:MAG: 50S ribosomal protein L28 [Chloroflexi bacterium]|nr:50S ribosomal protein L28 [Chloroflexota bacterium]
MAKCYVCGRGAQYGHKVSHSKRHTNRRFDLNIQKSTVREAGKAKRVDICTRCMRSQVKS